jgi:acyl-coenzyme A synthetase/AMP-(fatty) acid ligase
MEPDPARPGWRVFRTGDLMRLGADGLLRFVCRADRQIKINGVRIEPGEIEAVLRREPGVVDAVVAGRTIDGRVVLEAFVAAPDCDAAGLRRVLQSRMRDALLPAMRPSRLMVLAALARLPGGKVDLVGMWRVADSGAANG